MNEQVGATIIPFPVRRPAEPPQSTERLAASLRSLSAALIEQRDALHRWRDALADLSAKMQAVGNTASRELS